MIRGSLRLRYADLLPTFLTQQWLPPFHSNPYSQGPEPSQEGRSGWQQFRFKPQMERQELPLEELVFALKVTSKADPRFVPGDFLITIEGESSSLQLGSADYITSTDQGSRVQIHFRWVKRTYLEFNPQAELFLHFNTSHLDTNFQVEQAEVKLHFDNSLPTRLWQRLSSYKFKWLHLAYLLLTIADAFNMSQRGASLIDVISFAPLAFLIYKFWLDLVTRGVALDFGSAFRLEIGSNLLKAGLATLFVALPWLSCGLKYVAAEDAGLACITYHILNFLGQIIAIGGLGASGMRYIQSGRKRLR